MHMRLSTLSFLVLGLVMTLLVSCEGDVGGTKPAPPGNVQAFASGGKITVTWQNQSTLASSFNIYREAQGAAVQTLTFESQAFEKIAEVSASLDFYEDSSFDLGVSYLYAVSAVSSGGESARIPIDSPVSIANKPPRIQDFTLESNLEVATLRASVVDDDGEISEVTIDWGDGNSDTISSNFTNILQEHSYTSFDSFTVTLTATDNQGQQVSESQTLTLSDFPEQGLIAEFLTFETWENRVLPDTSGQGNNGYTNTSGSGDISTGTDRFGLADKAFDFFGVNAGQASVLEIRSNAADGSIDYGDALSMAIWIGESRNGFIIGQKEVSNRFRSPGLLIERDMVSFDVPLANNEDGFALADPEPLTDGWHFYVVTLERSSNQVSISLYRDGELVNEGSLSGANAEVIPSASPIVVGARASFDQGSHGNDYQGVLDDIRIFDRVLSVGEVRALYQEKGWTGNP